MPRHFSELKSGGTIPMLSPHSEKWGTHPPPVPHRSTPVVGSNCTASTVRCDMVIFPVYVRKVEITGNYDIMCVVDRPALPSSTIANRPYSLSKVPLRLFSHLLTHFWQEIASLSLFPFHNPLTALISDYIHARYANVELHING